MLLFLTILCLSANRAYSYSWEDGFRVTRAHTTIHYLEESTSILQLLLQELPEGLRDKILVTEAAERKLLDEFCKSENVPNEVVGAYNSAKNDERQVLKRLLADAESYAPRILETYKLIRKGKAWKYNTEFQPYREFFKQPSAALTTYETLKKDELESLDSFLSEPKKSIAMRQKEIEEAEELYRMARAKAEEIVQKEEKTEEVDDELRGQTIEARRTGKEATNQEKTGDNVAPAENVKTTNDISKSQDDVRSAESTHTKNTANENASDSTDFVRIAILFSVSINTALAILVLGLYRKEIVEWYRSSKVTKATSVNEETESLLPVRKASANGTAYKVLKTIPDAISK